jgi:hypothetical protein
MSTADSEDLKEEICTQLLLGKENGEAELETMARMVWVERQKYLTVPVSERIQQFFEGALEAVRESVLLLLIGSAVPTLANSGFLSGRPARARVAHLVLLSLRTRRPGGLLSGSARGSPEGSADLRLPPDGTAIRRLTLKPVCCHRSPGSLA